MGRIAMMSAVVLAVAASCLGEERLPIGPLPEYGLARIVEGGDLEIAHCVSRPVYETRTKLVPESVPGDGNGKAADRKKVRTVTYTVRKWVSDVRTIAVKAPAFRVWQGSEPLDPAAAGRLLAKATPVVFVSVSDFEEKLDPFYLRLLKPGTVVVYIRREATVAPGLSR